MYNLRNMGRLHYDYKYPVSKMQYGRDSSMYTSLTHDMEIASYFQETSEPWNPLPKITPRMKKNA